MYVWESSYFWLRILKIKEAISFTETHTVPQLPAPVRLQEYGVGIFVAVPTKSALKKALKKKLITVNDAVASSATLIHGGEHIRLAIPEGVGPTTKLIFPLRVLFEDDHLAAIHKPAGILVSGNRFKTIANALPQNLQRSPLPDAAKPQPVHRLDYATTGILLVGKTSSSIRALNQMFADKEIAKSYYAVAIGAMEPAGEITSDIDGKRAQSAYRVCESVASERFTRLNLVELRPQTGRRHQLRKHLSGSGNPILGDRDYGQEPLILKGKGMYLHASSLRFRHPFTGEEMVLEDAPPASFKKLFLPDRGRAAN